jgi:hypothetical protein
VSSERSKGDLPFFREYLNSLKGGTAQKSSTIDAVGCIAMLAAPIAVAIAMRTFPWFATLFASALAFIITTIIVASTEQRLKSPKTDEDKRKAADAELIQNLLKKSEKRRLRKDIQPDAAALLEACAYYHGEIRKLFKSPAWNLRSQGEHWKQVETQSLQASESAMREALRIASPSVGYKYGRIRADGTEGSYPDYTIDFDRYLSDLQEIDPKLEPLRDLGQKLRKLAKEVESHTNESHAAAAASSGLELDSALNSLQAIRQAEQELEQAQQLNQGLSP